MRPQGPGGSLDVYYDVCGLAEGTPYHVDVVVSSGESALRKLLRGGGRPIRASYDEVADGPRERFHRSLDIGELEMGVYSLTVSYSDARGRTRERRQEFRIAD